MGGKIMFFLFNEFQDTDSTKFKALQYALFTTSFVEILGGVFFLITAAYILRDKSKVEAAIAGKSNYFQLVDNIENSFLLSLRWRSPLITINFKETPFKTLWKSHFIGIFHCIYYTGYQFELSGNDSSVSEKYSSINVD